MKITCQSCQAKYTIADEKVAGKTVKIKCKKCGAAIVVNANDAAAGDAPAHGAGEEDDDGATRVFSGDPAAAGGGGGDEWTVNVSDDDQRTMSTGAVAAAYAAGTVTADTYVWKDGMSDWLPLAQVPEIMAAVGSAGGAAAAAPAPAAEDEGDLGATVVMPEGSAAPMVRGAATAARKTGDRQDLFGSQKGEPEPAGMAPAAPKGSAVGERNENSVLFSLSALTAAEKAAAKDDVGGGKKKDGRGGLDDIMNLGGGGLGGPMLAPPPLMAPVVEPPPPQMMPMTGTQVPLTGTQMPLTGTQVPQVVMVQVPEQKKSSAGLIVGIALGVVVAGAAAFFLLKQPEQPTTTTENSATPTQSAASTASAAPTAAPTETVAAAPTASSSATPAATDTSKAGSSGGSAPVATAGGTGPKPTTTTTATAAPTAAPTPTQTATAEAPAGKEFNRGAASSALGAAAGAAKSCKTADGPTGSGRVKVTFAPSGNVTSAQVLGPPFAGTSVGGCVAGVFRGARVPPFDGSPISVTKSFSIN